MIRKLHAFLMLMAFAVSPALCLVAPVPARAVELKIVTPTRDIARGGVISTADIALGDAPNRVLSGNIITDLGGGTGAVASTYYILQENAGRIQLESGAGFLELELAP